MKELIPAIARESLKAELTKDKFVRKTNFNNNELYIVTHHDSPLLMQEIGRLREISFRAVGGGTGKEADIDKYDTAENPYKQLIVWDPEDEEILGGYRFLFGENIPRDENGKVSIASTGLFEISHKFETEYLPYTIELGRSFVQPKYQARSAGRKGLFALDNLWDGLGALHVLFPGSKYYFGKVTMYPDFDRVARDLILYFYNYHFQDSENLVYPKDGLKLSYETDTSEFSTFFSGDYKQDYKILSRKVRDLGQNIPPLVNTYMNLSPNMKMFGTALNSSFGNVEETGILITIADIYDSKKERHIESYIEELKQRK